MDQTLEDAAIKTAMWWAEVIQKPLNQNNGDSSGTMFMMMNMVAANAQKELTPEKIAVFEKALVKLIMSQNSRYQQSCSVDYAPCNKLSEAALEAGISASVFPCKSSSWINEDNDAMISLGYRGERKIL